MGRMLRNAAMLLLLMTVITGIAYPLLVTGLAQVIFPVQANGSLLAKDGKPIGSALIGQQFTASKYFWGRPSATAPQAYNGTASNGSNLGPTNPALADAMAVLAADVAPGLGIVGIDELNPFTRKVQADFGCSRLNHRQQVAGHGEKANGNRIAWSYATRSAGRWFQHCSSTCR